MIVLPTHRLFRGLPAMTAAQLVERLGDCFDYAAPRAAGSEMTTYAWETIELEASQGTLGLFAAADQRWLIARITHAGQQRMAELATEHSEDWQGLGVAILHRLVIDTLAGSQQTCPSRNTCTWSRK